jgi:transcriptional regulator with GAF, ATPase, and Fis domain
MKNPQPPGEPLATDPDQALAALRRAILDFVEEEADSDRTLRIALDRLIEVTGADAGAVGIPGGTDGRPTLLAQRFLRGATAVSMTALQSTLDAPEPRAAIAEPPRSRSVYGAGITSILCTPVRRHGETLAAVYLDRRQKAPFDEVARSVAESFAAMLALALDLTRKAERLEERAEDARIAAAHASGFWRFGAIATRNRAFAECLQVAEQAAATEATLLILGETGSGKEHLARCVHEGSARRKHPFIAVNCAAVPETLLESELFGHEKGAFTGAAESRRGKFELAHGGTVFLDEIGDAPLDMQPKLLRVLEEKKIWRLGASSEKTVDVRIVAATNKDLAREVRHGRFREDLYYRLNVVTVSLPPLRERVEDIAPLAERFLELARERSGRELRWTDAALQRLAQAPWPGNVRQLRNVVEKLCVLLPGPAIDVRDLQKHLFREARAAEPDAEPTGSLARRMKRAEREILKLKRLLKGSAQAGRLMPEGTDPEGLDHHSLREQLDAASRRIIQRTLRRTGSISAAARQLGLSRQSLHARCKKMGLEKP